jgi:hypothetical protein
MTMPGGGGGGGD